MTVKKQWPPNLKTMYGNIMSGEAEPKPVSQLKLAMKKIWDSLPQVQLTKLSRVLEIV